MRHDWSTSRASSQSMSASSRSATARGIDARRRRVDPTTQRIERHELFRRQRPLGEVHQRREQRVARLLQFVDRTRRRRRWIVELVGKTGGERAERDERFTLARERADHAHRLEEALDQVEAEGEPGPDEVPERRRWHPRSMRPGSVAAVAR